LKDQTKGVPEQEAAHRDINTNSYMPEYVFFTNFMKF